MRTETMLLSSLALAGYLFSRAVKARPAPVRATTKTRAAADLVAVARRNDFAMDAAGSNKEQSRSPRTWSEAEILADFGGRR
jgi:hypothetical protein